MQLRFYFPLFQATQLLGGAAYRQEVKKLRKIGFEKIVPYIKGNRLKEYPYNVCVIFMVYDTADFITLSIISAYILHLIEKAVILQSTDWRVISSLSIKTKKISLEKEQGCIILINQHINNKTIKE